MKMVLSRHFLFLRHDSVDETSVMLSGRHNSEKGRLVSGFMDKVEGLTNILKIYDQVKF